MHDKINVQECKNDLNLLPTSSSDEDLAKFSRFFIDKVTLIREALKQNKNKKEIPVAF